VPCHNTHCFLVALLLAVVALDSGCRTIPGAETTENWPTYRGVQASGVGSRGTRLPTTWDLASGRNIKWQTAIPGLSHASPVIWGDRMYLITAIDTSGNAEFRTGVSGDVSSLPQEGRHQWRMYCLDKHTGEIIWDRLGYEGLPRSRRHAKASQANSTPATDGRYVVTFFGSEGLFCYNTAGELLWSKDLGDLSAGWFKQKDSQWGFGSSPVIYKDRVIVQCDCQSQQFIAAFSLATGEELWRTLREDYPTWGPPTLVQTRDRAHVIANGYKEIAAYDADTGARIWWMRGGGDIPVPAPMLSRGLIYITNSHGGQSPIYAVRPDATGDITLTGTDNSSDYIAWSIRKGGAYIITPVIVGNYIHVPRFNGVMSCYHRRTGKRQYQERMSTTPGGFWASPVAADGKIYVPAESGDVHVFKAGRRFERLATNPMGEHCMAAPAISENTLFIRTINQVVAIAYTAVP